MKNMSKKVNGQKNNVNVKENEVMSNVVEVFGVNVVEVEEQVRHLVEVYKTSGKKATLKEWGHKMTDEVWGSNYIIRLFLRVLFEAKNDEFINKVLEESDPTAWFGEEMFKPYYAEEPRKWNISLMGYMGDFARAWAVYNLPILQEVMDALVEYMTENPDYVDDCYAVEDMMDAIKEDGGSHVRPFFQSYVSPYIVEFMKSFNLEKLEFDEDEAEEIDLDYLEYVWNAFCETVIIEDILLSYYESFMDDAVREVLEYKGF